MVVEAVGFCFRLMERELSGTLLTLQHPPNEFALADVVGVNRRVAGVENLAGVRNEVEPHV